MSNKIQKLKNKLHSAHTRILHILNRNVELKKESIAARQELDEFKSRKMDFKKVFDAYYPVIVACRELRAHYGGDNKHKTPLVMPDPAGNIMITLRSAERQYNIVLHIQEVKDVKEENENEESKD